MAVVTAAQACEGILLLDKPAGWTSHDVVAKLRGLVRGAKVGHAGTLDPDATGLLPVLLGQATRIAEYLIGWDKEYRAVLRLGATTDTQDASGRVLSVRAVPVLTLEQVWTVAAQFEGTIAQMPPMYSAVKVDGVPLYRSARAGKTIEREARPVTIHRLTVLGLSGTDVDMDVHCSKGTYIRTLCADLGEALGCGGHLLSLRRTRVGPLMLEHALTLEEAGRRWEAGTLGESLVSLDDALSAMPAVRVDESTAGRVLHGVAVPWSSVLDKAGWAEGRPANAVRIKDVHGHLLAIGTSADTSLIRIKKVLATTSAGI